MKLEKRQLSGREKDEESIKLLSRLREKLYSEHAGTARRAAFNLSWMQEDGLDILREALFGKAARRTKSAAAYGLRKMRGRMEKAALEVLSQGLRHSDSTTAEACDNALLVLKGSLPGKLASKRRLQAGKIAIREVRGKSRQRNRREQVGRQRNNFHR